jgi:hypothetical protein
MPKSLNAPKNPEFLAGTVAAMRLLSGERQPQNQLEREILAQLQALQLKPEVAKRIVAAFDAKPQADAQHLLGRFADKNHALERMVPSAPPNVVIRDHRSGASSGGAASTASTSRMGPASDVVGPLSEEATRDGRLPGIRYTVRYKGLWCQEETDGPGSDEIYIITSGLTINNDVNAVIETLTHPMGTDESHYSDVDSLEERVGPVAAVYTGSPDTLSLAVVVMEHDYGDPNHYRDEVKTFVDGGIALATYLWGPAAVLAYFKDNIVDAINWILGTGDDVISSEVVTWERPALEALAVQTPGYYQGWKREVVASPFGPPTLGPLVNIQTGLLINFVTEHHGDGSKYVVAFDIERDPPRPPPIIL